MTTQIQLIKAQINNEWGSYAPHECDIEPIDASNTPPGAAGVVQPGDWLVCTKDGVYAEVLRIGGDLSITEVWGSTRGAA